MLINPSRECYAYADIGPQKHLEIRKVAGRLQPVLCTTEGEQLITSHNLPNLRSDHDLTQVISKLARGCVMVAYSSGEWHVAYHSKRQVRGFSPLVIPPQQAPRTKTQEAAREGRDVSANNNLVDSNLHSGNRSRSSSTSDESYSDCVEELEEGGAPGENIPPAENRGNLDPRLNLAAHFPRSTGLAALPQEGVFILNQRDLSQLMTQAVQEAVEKALKPSERRMEAALNQVVGEVRNLRTEVSQQATELSEAVDTKLENFATRAREERAQERQTCKEEDKEERIREHEHYRRIHQERLEELREAFNDEASSSERFRQHVAEDIGKLQGNLGGIATTFAALVGAVSIAFLRRGM